MRCVLARRCVAAAAMLLASGAAAQPASFTDLGSMLQPGSVSVPIHLQAGNDIVWLRVELPPVSTEAGFVDVWSETPYPLGSSIVLNPQVFVFDGTGSFVAASNIGYWAQAKLSFGLLDPRAPVCFAADGETACDEIGFLGQEGFLAGGTYWFVFGTRVNIGPSNWTAISWASPDDPQRDSILHIRVQPPNLSYCDADLNWDGSADAGDIDYLVNVLAGGDNLTGRFPDFNRDGSEDQDDVAALINTVGGGGCP